MLLVDPSLISEIDNFASEKLGISKRTLMLRAAEAVAGAVRSYVYPGAIVRIFAGKGNNGGDAYAAAGLLMRDYDVKVYDVFSAGQRTDEGKYYLDSYVAAGGIVEPLSLDDQALSDIRASDCIIDAIFGTGFAGDLPKIAVEVAEILASSEDKALIAVDVPLGVNASDGSVADGAVYRATATVALGFVKSGLVSYPAKEYIGKLIFDNIGLHNNEVLSNFTFSNYYTDYELASSFIPKREENSNKGSFGKLLMLTGSEDYPGAAHLSLEASLRSGVGYVTFLGEKTLCDSLISKLPEAIYKPGSVKNNSPELLDEVSGLSDRHSATLIGSGSSRSEGLRRLLIRLLSKEGSPLILDADAINALSENPKEGRGLIKNSPRKVILTPHPLELSRISGIPTNEIQANRLSVARSFALDNNCILVLKGAATVVTDGRETYINSSGSSALAKAGSGDVLAGFLASLVASGYDPLRASTLAVYFHGLAADVLAKELSPFGVTPSDLPREIARQLAKAINQH